MPLQRGWSQSLPYRLTWQQLDLQALKELCSEHEDFAKDLVIDLYGMVDFAIKESITDHGLDNNVYYGGTLPRKAILQKIVDAHVLLLPLNKSQNILGRIPGKLFEYLASKNRIILTSLNWEDIPENIRESL